MIVCSYEDRPSSLVGIKLLILSLKRHCPDLDVHIYVPDADADFCTWVGLQSNVSLISTPKDSLRGWDIKPTLLLDRLDAGFDEVIWLDSDIIIVRDFRQFLEKLPNDVYVATEEPSWAPWQGSQLRTKRLGLELGRIFPKTINTCVNRVTPFHRQLLERWNETLHRTDYQDSQSKSYDDREFHLGCDQDLLTGLLGSTEFVHIPVMLLRSGHDVAHCFLNRGYPIRSRLGNLFKGLPTFVHAQGPKPWDIDDELFAELSPYCAEALSYEEKLLELTPWMKPRSRWGLFLHWVTFGNPNLRDLPIVLVHEVGVWLGKLKFSAN